MSELKKSRIAYGPPAAPLKSEGKGAPPRWDDFNRIHDSSALNEISEGFEYRP